LRCQDKPFKWLVIKTSMLTWGSYYPIELTGENKMKDTIKPYFPDENMIMYIAGSILTWDVPYLLASIAWD
jgi:hypothetical protein